MSLSEISITSSPVAVIVPLISISLAALPPFNVCKVTSLLSPPAVTATTVISPASLLAALMFMEPSFVVTLVSVRASSSVR